MAENQFPPKFNPNDFYAAFRAADKDLCCQVNVTDIQKMVEEKIVPKQVASMMSKVADSEGTVTFQMVAESCGDSSWCKLPLNDVYRKFAELVSVKAPVGMRRLSMTKSLKPQQQPAEPVEGANFGLIQDQKVLKPIDPENPTAADCLTRPDMNTLLRMFLMLTTRNLIEKNIILVNKCCSFKEACTFMMDLWDEREIKNVDQQTLNSITQLFARYRCGDNEITAENAKNIARLFNVPTSKLAELGDENLSWEQFFDLFGIETLDEKLTPDVLLDLINQFYGSAGKAGFLNLDDVQDKFGGLARGADILRLKALHSARGGDENNVVFFSDFTHMWHVEDDRKEDEEGEMAKKAVAGVGSFGDDTATLEWTPINTSDPTRVLVQQFNDETGTWEVIATAEAGAGSFTVNGLDAGKNYKFRVVTEAHDKEIGTLNVRPLTRPGSIKVGEAAAGGTPITWGQSATADGYKIVTVDSEGNVVDMQEVGDCACNLQGLDFTGNGFVFYTTKVYPGFLDANGVMQYSSDTVSAEYTHAPPGIERGDVTLAAMELLKQLEKVFPGVSKITYNLGNGDFRIGEGKHAIPMKVSHLGICRVGGGYMELEDWIEAHRDMIKRCMDLMAKKEKTLVKPAKKGPGARR